VSEQLATLTVGSVATVLRRAVTADVPALVALLADDPLGLSRESTANGALAPYFDAFALIDADPAQLLMVAEDDGEVVGTLQLSVIPGLSRRGSLRAQVEAVRVRESHRDRGLGGAMFEWVIDEARRRGCALVQLTSNERRTDAHRFTSASASVPATRASSSSSERPGTVCPSRQCSEEAGATPARSRHCEPSGEPDTAAAVPDDPGRGPRVR
jgi:GNAT superfamily N-acetyltransferase